MGAGGHRTLESSSACCPFPPASMFKLCIKSKPLGHVQLASGKTCAHSSQPVATEGAPPTPEVLLLRLLMCQDHGDFTSDLCLACSIAALLNLSATLGEPSRRATSPGQALEAPALPSKLAGMKRRMGLQALRATWSARPATVCLLLLNFRLAERWSALRVQEQTR